MILKNQDTGELLRSLAHLLHSGISLADGVYLLSQDGPQELRQLLHAMGQAMDQGNSLSQAMEESGSFPPALCAMVRIGECTGRMEQTLNALAQDCDARCRSRRQIKQALAYPSLILLLMLAVIGVMLVKVLPVFDAVYRSLGSRLTGTAAGLLYIGQLLHRALPGILVMLAAVCLLAAGCRFLPTFRAGIQAWLVRRFGDRGIPRRYSNARFVRALAMGLSSGLTLEEALDLAGQLLQDNPGAQARILACRAALEGGTSLDTALAEAGLLTPAQGRLLSVGLRSGSGDEILQDIARQLMDQAQESLEDTVSRIEPAMVLICSLLVGLILLSVMLPLINIMSTIG